MAAKQKILIVDDDNNIAELISLYLTKECFDTKIVNDGEEALKAFEQYNPNLILLDLMLPGIDGYQVCREVRAKANVPIIMLSAKVHGYLTAASSAARVRFTPAERPSVEVLNRFIDLLDAILLSKSLSLGQRTVGDARKLAAGKSTGVINDRYGSFCIYGIRERRNSEKNSARM